MTQDTAITPGTQGHDASNADSPDATLRFEIRPGSDDDKYLLKDRTDILYYLRSLQQKGAMISVYPGEGPQAFLTRLLAIDEKTGNLIFDPSQNEQDNAKALASRLLVFITQLDKVRIQFTLPALELTDYIGGPAFKGAIPGQMVRLQRRDYFRLTAPANPRIHCVMSVKDENGREQHIDMNLLDISGGGVGVLVPPVGLSFVPDTVFTNVRIALPEQGEISASIKVCNVFTITQRDGTTRTRAGCQFVGLAPQMRSAIQRYIMRVERERSELVR